MTDIAGSLVHVFRHPHEAVTVDTLERAHHSSVFVMAGTTEHFLVEYQHHLGYAGQVLAQGVLRECEADYARLAEWFAGVVPPNLPFQVSIVRGSFGAFHDACTDTHLRCSAFDGHNAELVEMLTMAEAVEVFAAAQNAGWNCGESNGEGLSRVLATALHPTQLDGFATAGDWLNSRRENFVARNERTDLDPVSTGCAVLFLNFLHHQLRHPWATIVMRGRPTLAATYQALQNANDGWEQFSALIAAHFPRGRHAHVTGDNIFPL